MQRVLQKLAQLPLWSIIVLAVLLRLPLLNGSFWLDEAAQALESVRPFHQQLEIAEDFQPPLLHILLHFASFFSHAEWWFRLWGALLPGLITIYCTYKITEKLFSKRVAMITTGLLVTSSFHIFYSQELRPYSLSAAIAAISWLILAKASFESKAFSFKYMIGYALTTALGLYSTYLYPFVILSQVGYIIWKERQFFKYYLMSCTISGLLFLPWLPYLLEQLAVGQALRANLPGWEAVVSIPQLKSLPLTLGKFMFGVLNIEITPLFIVSTALFLGGLFWALVLLWRENRTFIFSKQLALILSWLVIPLITSWLVSFAIPIVQPKRVIYLLPAFYMLVTAVVLQLQTLKPTENSKTKSATTTSQNTPRVQVATVVMTIWLLLFLNVYSSIQYYLQPEYQREDWRQIHQTITTNYPSDAAVIFAFDAAFAPWRWYDDTSYPVFATGSLTTGGVSKVEADLRKASEYSYLLVFDYLRDLTDPERKIDAALQNLGYSEKEVFALPGIGFVRVFARQEDVIS